MDEEVKQEVIATTEAKPVEAAPVEAKPVAKPRTARDKNTVFIGTKPFMNYVTAVVMQFTIQNSGEVMIKSRGKFISKAVDVAEVVKRRFMSGQIDVADVIIGSESFENKEGRQVSVSTIEIKLAKI